MCAPWVLHDMMGPPSELAGCRLVCHFEAAGSNGPFCTMKRPFPAVIASPAFSAPPALLHLIVTTPAATLVAKQTNPPIVRTGSPPSWQTLVNTSFRKASGSTDVQEAQLVPREKMCNCTCAAGLICLNLIASDRYSMLFGIVINCSIYSN